MKERLLLDGIALHAADVAPGHVERAAPVVANFADAGQAVGNGAAVAAGIAAHAIAVELFVEYSPSRTCWLTISRRVNKRTPLALILNPRMVSRISAPPLRSSLLYASDPLLRLLLRGQDLPMGHARGKNRNPVFAGRISFGFR